MINDNDRPFLNPSFTAEKMDDEILLYSKKSTKAVYLNDTAHLVWLLCQETLTVGQMIVSLQEQYPDQKEQIRTDVISALEMLHQSDVIQFANEERL